MGLQRFRDARGGAFAVGHGVHNFAAAVDAIASGKVLRIGWFAPVSGFTTTQPFFSSTPLQLRKKIEQAGLADGRNDHVAGNLEIGTWNRLGWRRPLRSRRPNSMRRIPRIPLASVNAPRAA